MSDLVRKLEGFSCDKTNMMHRLIFVFFWFFKSWVDFDISVSKAQIDLVEQKSFEDFK